MKTIRQLSTELGISKEAIYKKIKFQLKEQLAGHARKVGNVTRIDGEGELMIRQSLHRERREAIEGVMEAVVEGGPPFEPPQGHLAEYVGLLREQIRAKDAQIESQSGHIGQLIRQLGVAQLLPQARRLGEMAAEGRESEPVAAAEGPAGRGRAEKNGAREKGAGRNVWKKIFGRGKIAGRL
jgi:hypothetical protein